MTELEANRIRLVMSTWAENMINKGISPAVLITMEAEKIPGKTYGANIYSVLTPSSAMELLNKCVIAETVKEQWIDFDKKNNNPLNG